MTILYNKTDIIFWLYDRVSFDKFGKELTKDIDLVVDSIPAICFLLRTTNISNKCYINIGKSLRYVNLKNVIF